MTKIYAYISKLVTFLKERTKSLAQGKENYEDRDVARIQFSSRLLQISEFKLFQLAYVRWYGSEMPEKKMEAIFSDYMFNNEVPHWARDLARRVISRFFQGTLDPREFNIDCRVPPVELMKPTALQPIFMSIIYVVFFLILSGYIKF